MVRVGYIQLLEIAEIQGIKEDIIKYARLLFLDNYGNERDYYELLKGHISPSDWHSFMEEIILEIKSKGKWVDKGLLASIYIKEEWWERLFLQVKEQPELSHIKYYEKYLIKDYQKEITELYGNAIIDYMKNSVGRSHYKNACRYLRKIIKLGNEERAIEIIAFLKETYPKRRALLEELSKV